MLGAMAYRPQESKMVVQARVDAKDVEQLDKLADKEGTIHYRRSRSELIAFAIHEYVEKYTSEKKAQGR